MEKAVYVSKATMPEQKVVHDIRTLGRPIRRLLCDGRGGKEENVAARWLAEPDDESTAAIRHLRDHAAAWHSGSRSSCGPGSRDR